MGKADSVTWPPKSKVSAAALAKVKQFALFPKKMAPLGNLAARREGAAPRAWVFLLRHVGKCAGSPPWQAIGCDHRRPKRANFARVDSASARTVTDGPADSDKIGACLQGPRQGLALE